MKGQWFIISAVLATTALVAIATLFQSYRLVDTSSIALIDEDFYFNNMKDGLKKTVQLSNCVEMDKNIKEFFDFAKRSLAEKGYLLSIGHSIDCSNRLVDFTLTLKSDKYQVKDDYSVAF